MATKLASLIWHFHTWSWPALRAGSLWAIMLYSAVGGCTFRRLVGCRIAPCFKIEICVAFILDGFDVLVETFQK